MKSSSLIWIIVIVLVVLAAGWYFVMMPKSPAPAATAQGPQQGTVVNTNPNGHDYSPGNLLLGTDSSAALGTYLIGSNGMTLYTYASDTPGVSNCTGQCATNWLPYTVADTSALPNLEAGVTGTAGTLTRADGTMQVTYNGMPLYFYIGDKNSGDTLGNLADHAGWEVVKP